MEGPESFKRIKPDEKIELEGTTEEQIEKMNKAQLEKDAEGVKAEELSADENVVMEGGAEKRAESAEAEKKRLEEALNNTVVEEGEEIELGEDDFSQAA